MLKQHAKTIRSNESSRFSNRCVCDLKPDHLITLALGRHRSLPCLGF